MDRLNIMLYLYIFKQTIYMLSILIEIYKLLYFPCSK